jgi:phage baseplate assembly protein W
MRTGVDRETGEILQGWDECRQSIGVIVTTARGSLVLNRDFGADAPGLQDRPQSRPSIMDHFMAIAEALRKWEPGFRLRRVSVVSLGPDGRAAFAITGDFYPDGHRGDFSRVMPSQSLVVAL